MIGARSAISVKGDTDRGPARDQPRRQPRVRARREAASGTSPATRSSCNATPATSSTTHEGHDHDGGEMRMPHPRCDRATTAEAALGGAGRCVRAVIGVTVITLAFAGLVTAWLHGVRLPIASGKTIIKVQKFASANFQGEPGGTQFMLLIGSDLRPGVGGSRGDALHVLAVNPKLHKGTIINIPRDTCAAIPGRRHHEDQRRQRVRRSAAHGADHRPDARHPHQLLGARRLRRLRRDRQRCRRCHRQRHAAHERPRLGRVLRTRPRTTSTVAARSRFSRDRHDFARGDITRTENQGAVILSAMAQLRENARARPAGAFRLLAFLGRQRHDHRRVADRPLPARTARAVDRSRRTSAT